MPGWQEKFTGDGNGKPLLELLKYLENPIRVAISWKKHDNTKIKMAVY